MLEVNGTDAKGMQLRGLASYTIVGNPTIADGIASGFSDSNHFTLSQDFENSKINKIIFCGTIDDNSGSYNRYNYLYYKTAGNLQLSVYVNSEGVANFPAVYIPGPNESYTFDNFRPTLGQKFWLQYENDGNNIKLSSSTDGQNYTLRNTIENVAVTGTNGTWTIGNGSNLSTHYLNGSIDFNESKIYANKKLWFWQPKPAKYVMRNGKLIWADTKIYLQSSGTQYIDSGVYPTGTTTLDCSFSTGSNVMVFGARQSAGNKALNFFVESGSRGRFDYNNKIYINNSSGSWDLFTNGTLRSQITQSNEYYFEMTDRTSQEKRYASLSVGSFTSSVSMALFACNTAGSIGPFSSSKIYYFKIYQNGVLTRHFVPVPAGMIIGNTTIAANCLFDIVTQTPYYNAGTGDFAYGVDQ